MISSYVFISFFSLIAVSLCENDQSQYCQYTFENGQSYNISGAYQSSSDYCVTSSDQVKYCMNPCHNSLTCQQHSIETPFCIFDSEVYSGCGELNNVTVSELDGGGYVQIFSSGTCIVRFEYPCTLNQEESEIDMLSQSNRIPYNINFLSPYNCRVFPQTQNNPETSGIIYVQDFNNLDLSLNDWSIQLTETMGISVEYFIVYDKYYIESTKQGFNSYFLDTPSSSSSDLWEQLQNLIKEGDISITRDLGIYNAVPLSTSDDEGDDDGGGSDDTVIIVLCVVIPIVTIGLLGAIYVLYKRRQQTVTIRDYALYQGL